MIKPFYAAPIIFTLTLGAMIGVAMVEHMSDEPSTNIEVVYIQPPREEVEFEEPSSQEKLQNVTISAEASVHEEDQIWLRDISLDVELQEYIYNKCEEFNFDYDLILGLAWKESTFRTDIVSRTNDVGLLQINKNNQKWVNEMAGRSLDLFDPYDNIIAGLLILDNYRQQWIDKGVSATKLIQYTLNSYNMGVAGYRNAGYPSRSYDRDIQRKAAEIKEGN